MMCKCGRYMIPPGHTRCIRCQGDRKESEEPTWRGRWRVYPRSCAGHIIQGAAASLPLLAVSLWKPDNVMAVVVAVAVLAVWLWIYTAYQGLSGARKAVNRKKTDTMGLDVVDFLIGTMPVLITTLILV